MLPDNNQRTWGSWGDQNKNATKLIRGWIL